MGDITPADLARCRVRLADLPGFDATGLLLRDAKGDEEGIVVYDDGRDVLVHPEDGDDEPRYWTRDQEGDLDEEGPCVSTTDASTRDRLARWVAGRVKLPVGSTAPDWACRFTSPHWTLAGPQRGNGGSEAMCTFHQGLADLDPNDPRLLPDGSRRVDAVALAEVARHLGGERG